MSKPRSFNLGMLCPMVRKKKDPDINGEEFLRCWIKKSLFIAMILFLFANFVFAYTAILNYPNPFAPPSVSTRIYYILGSDADIKIYIFNVANRLVKKISCLSGSEGGKSGANQVVWDGRSNFGDIVQNGVYFCNVVNDGTLIGRCKIVVLK